MRKTSCFRRADWVMAVETIETCVTVSQTEKAGHFLTYSFTIKKKYLHLRRSTCDSIPHSRNLGHISRDCDSDVHVDSPLMVFSVDRPVVDWSRLSLPSEVRFPAGDRRSLLYHSEITRV